MSDVWIITAFGCTAIVIMLAAAITITRQDRDVERYRDALEWYADESHYRPKVLPSYDAKHPEIMRDCGMRARMALAQYKDVDDTDG